MVTTPKLNLRQLKKSKSDKSKTKIVTNSNWKYLHCTQLCSNVLNCSTKLYSTATSHSQQNIHSIVLSIITNTLTPQPQLLFSSKLKPLQPPPPLPPPLISSQIPRPNQNLLYQHTVSYLGTPVSEGGAEHQWGDRQEHTYLNNTKYI